MILYFRHNVTFVSYQGDPLSHAMTEAPMQLFACLTVPQTICESLPILAP